MFHLEIFYFVVSHSEKLKELIYSVFIPTKSAPERMKKHTGTVVIQYERIQRNGINWQLNSATFTR